MVWVVSANDGVIDPKHQRRSADLMGARVVELPTDHSVVTQAPEQLNQIIELSYSNADGPLLIAM
jgi:pimeloyl-ACP methyl ester carboxylesterase